MQLRFARSVWVLFFDQWEAIHISRAMQCEHLFLNLNSKNMYKEEDDSGQISNKMHSSLYIICSTECVRWRIFLANILQHHWETFLLLAEQCLGKFHWNKRTKALVESISFVTSSQNKYSQPHAQKHRYMQRVSRSCAHLEFASSRVHVCDKTCTFTWRHIKHGWIVTESK